MDRLLKLMGLQRIPKPRFTVTNSINVNISPDTTDFRERMAQQMAALTHRG